MKWKKIISGTLAAVLVLSSVITAVPIEAIAADNLVTAETSGGGNSRLLKFWFQRILL